MKYISSLIIFCRLTLAKLYGQDTIVYRNNPTLEIGISYPLMLSKHVNGVAEVGLVAPMRFPFLNIMPRLIYNIKIARSEKVNQLFWIHSIGYGFEKTLKRKKDATLAAVISSSYSFWHGNSVFEHGLGLSSSIEYHKKSFIISLGYELIGGGKITLDGVPLKLRGSIFKFGLGFHIK